MQYQVPLAYQLSLYRKEQSYRVIGFKLLLSAEFDQGYSPMGMMAQKGRRSLVRHNNLSCVLALSPYAVEIQIAENDKSSAHLIQPKQKNRHQKGI